ncbi:MAG: hypothetical protein C5B47_01330 [Verrucomicrobia bacterium]|nr:MAG: hypothetical protein C5B47_01330 [Verrucomicrobiota bacterium]
MKLVPWLVSLLVHGLILIGGSFELQQTRVEVMPGHGNTQLTVALNQTLPLPVSPPISHPHQQAIAAASPTSIPPSVHQIQQRPTSKNPPPEKNKHVHPHRANAVKEPPASGPDAIVERAPDYLSNPAPIYPEAAQERRQQGLVILEVIVGCEGRPESVKILSGSGYYLLDEAAKKAVENYRFKPALMNQVKIRSRVRVPIRFRLDE